ncbi:transglutaminase family protein [Fundidesulfovibrio butyratiphilus]
MRFRVVHETRYRYSKPVFLEPHLVRLCPASGPAQRLESFALEVTPRPSGSCALLDACGNTVHNLWFEGLWDELAVRATLTASTLRTNPYDYLLAPGAMTLPVDLTPTERLTLEPSLVPTGCPVAGDLSRELNALVQGDSVAYLHAANDWLHRNVSVTPRPEPGLQSPARTLGTRRGACRDVSLVFMELCRLAGLPARYVSCYQAGDPDQTEHDLHAVAEAYLPGAGWRGFDPTLGLAVADAHLALCASPFAEDTAPLTGTFRGDGATARLTHRIVIDILD